MIINGSRLLDALGLDMPSCEVILEYADETVFRVFAQVGAVFDMQITLVICRRRGTRRGLRHSMMHSQLVPVRGGADIIIYVLVRAGAALQGIHTRRGGRTQI